MNWVKGGGERWLVGLGVSGGLLLISGPAAWLMLLIFAGAFAWLRVGESVDLTGSGRAVLAFVLTAFLGSTALFLHWQGLGMAADLLPGWLRSFVSTGGIFMKTG